MVVNRKQYCLYGDAAYILGAYLQVAYPRAVSTEEQRAYRALMSAMREAVERTYKANVVFAELQKATQDSQVSNCAVIQVCWSAVERQGMSSSRRPSVLLL